MSTPSQPPSTPSPECAAFRETALAAARAEDEASSRRYEESLRHSVREAFEQLKSTFPLLTIASDGRSLEMCGDTFSVMASGMSGDGQTGYCLYAKDRTMISTVAGYGRWLEQRETARAAATSVLRPSWLDRLFS